VAVRGDRLVVGSGPGFVIMKKDGTVVKLVGTQGSGPDQFDGVKGLAISADGTIYVIDQYNNRVSAYDTNGNRLWIRSTGKAGNNTNVHTTNQSQVATTGADMQLPAGATIDGAGRLVVIDPFGFNLVVLNPKNGDLIAKYGEAGTAEGQFIYPSSVSYDPQRDWFAVADTANSRVQIVRIPGSGGSATSAIQRTLLGPIRACLIPLLLLIIVIVVSLIVRGFRRRRDAKAASETALPDTEPPAAEDV
jgi:tripartite motif-containing protein 2/3/tripartite motif-containing protein 71